MNIKKILRIFKKKILLIKTTKMKKQKLFSVPSLLTTIKGIGSSIVTGITAIPIWLLMMFFLRKEILALAVLTGLFTVVWYLFFWGFIANKLKIGK